MLDLPTHRRRSLPLLRARPLLAGVLRADRHLVIIDEAARLLGHRPTLRLGGILGNVSNELSSELLTVLREALMNVAKHAQDSNVPFTDFASLCRAPEVRELIWSEIERVNRNFARVETVKKFQLIEQQLTAEDEEVTPTMKLKRKFVNEKYKVMIDGMYAEAV